MDVFAHTLWTAAVYQRVALRDRLWAAFCGVAPDLASFGILFVQSFFTSGHQSGPPQLASIPLYIFTMYNLTHSLVVFVLVLSVVITIRRKVWWPLFGWALHIIIDIFTHSTDFFPTPFLWPLSTYRFNGIAWGESWFMFLNYLALSVVYVMWYWRVKTIKALKT